MSTNPQIEALKIEAGNAWDQNVTVKRLTPTIREKIVNALNFLKGKKCQIHPELDTRVLDTEDITITTKNSDEINNDEINNKNVTTIFNDRAKFINFIVDVAQFSADLTLTLCGLKGGKTIKSNKHSHKKSKKNKNNNHKKSKKNKNNYKKSKKNKR
jgi:hypothetical protein